MTDSSVSTTFITIDQHLQQLIDSAKQLQTYLQQNRPAVIPSSIYESVYILAAGLERLRKQVNALEEERRSLRALAQIGQVVNSSLDLDIVLQIVMDTIIRLMGAERGFLMLKDDEGILRIRIARNWEQETVNTSELTISRTIVYRVAKDGQPLITTNAQEDPRFEGQQSIVAYNLQSILCVPLVVKSELIGVIYADNRIRTGMFKPKDLDLLVAFANQAAVAIENARLFASVRKTLSEVIELKNLMDNIFSSIASGVVTANLEDRIMLCNKAAEVILGLGTENMIGRGLDETLGQVGPALAPHLDRVMQTDQPVLGIEMSSMMGERGQVDLRLSLTPLKDIQHHTQGVAIVLEDLTEKKHLEAQRRLFERMVSPAVINQLDPDSIRLGGQRKEITILFADIRSFSSFSESVMPEELVSVLNRYMAAAADAILTEEGTIDKFMGDAVMAWFNAPIIQSDHALRAIRSAVAIRTAISQLHKILPPKHHLSFGVGIHVGDAVLGMVGTEKRMEYTAIGDSVNIAKRLQEFAGPGEILITKAAYLRVADKVTVRPVEPFAAKGKRDLIEAFAVLELK